MSQPADAAPKKKSKLLPVVLAVTVATAGAATALTPRSVLYAAIGAVPADSSATAAAAVPYGEFVEMDALVVNPQGTDGRRYLMARVGVEAAKPETLERFGVLGPAARDAVLGVLSRRTVAELSDIARRDSLKEEIRTVLNGILGEDGPLTRVYFTQYVLQ